MVTGLHDRSDELLEVISDPTKIEELDSAKIKLLMAKLAAVQMALTTRLLTAVSTANTSDAMHDEVLTVKDAAARMKVSADYIYRHSAKFPFTIRQGRMLRFSAKGLDKYLKQRQVR